MLRKFKGAGPDYERTAWLLKHWIWQMNTDFSRISRIKAKMTAQMYLLGSVFDEDDAVRSPLQRR